jgi:hypothetical protein
MSVTANQLIARQDGCKVSHPVEEATTLYQGTLVFLNAAGYAVGDDAAGSNRFAGIAIGEADNSAGADGDIEVECWAEGDFPLVGSGFSQASVGLDVYATDNFTISTTAAGTKIGRVTRYVSSTKVIVSIETKNFAVPAGPVTKTADFTVTVQDSGRTFDTTGATGTVVAALPAAVPGLKYRFRVGAAQELRLDPNGTETIALPSTGVAGAAGAYITANAAGETVDIECVVAGTWNAFGYSGTWTAQP